MEKRLNRNMQPHQHGLLLPNESLFALRSLVLQLSPPLLLHLLAHEGGHGGLGHSIFLVLGHPPLVLLGQARKVLFAFAAVLLLLPKILLLLMLLFLLLIALAIFVPLVGTEAPPVTDCASFASGPRASRSRRQLCHFLKAQLLERAFRK